MKTKKVTVTFLMAVGLMTMLFLVCPRMEVNAKTTITVNSVDQKTAKAVHSQLMKGKEFDIRIPGNNFDTRIPGNNQHVFYSKFQKLTKKVAKCTDYGVDIFPICMENSLYFGYSGGDNPVQSGGYTTFTIKKKHCEEYIYGIKYAERESKAFKTYINKVLKDTEYLRDSLTNGTAFVDELNYKKTKTVIAEAKQTIKSLKEFKKYLQKTKFRNLSGAMKARIILEIGDSNNGWSKKSMKQDLSKNGFSNSFKALYKRKAYGSNLNFASTTCKMCAVFQIGEANNFFIDYGMIARIKVKNLKGKVRYAVLRTGRFDDDYNFYAGSPNANLVNNYRPPSKPETIKKIKKTQKLSPIRLAGRGNVVYRTGYDGNTFWTDYLIIYKFTIPKSEW